MSNKTKNIIRIVILFLLLLLPIFYAMVKAIDLESSLLKKIAYFGAVLSLLFLPALFFKTRTYFIIEGIFNFLLFPIDIASLYLNHQSASAPFIQNIFRTDFREAAELLLSFWPLCLLILATWIIYFILASRVENSYFLSRKQKRIIAGLIVIIWIIGYSSSWWTQKHSHPSIPPARIAMRAFNKLSLKFNKIYPYNLYIHIFDIIQQQRHLNALSQQLSSFHFGIMPTSYISPAIYVLVIGETVRYDHLGINGYWRNTTPYLSQQSNLISFDSVYSQANLTNLSLPTLLTRATSEHIDKAYCEKSLPEAFMEAGFKSYYISKQLPFPFTARVMQSCDYSYYYPKDYDVDANYDEEMISLLKNHGIDSLQFVLLHSLGSHFRYELRYPATFEVFQPVFGSSFTYAKVSKENKDKLVNAYDNSILYTDYFLHSLIKYIDSLDRPAVVLYISDHGENLCDDERQMLMHGAYSYTPYEFHVPLLVWYSDEYSIYFPNKVISMQANKSVCISSDVIFYSMLDFADIPDIVDSTRSICSSSLAPIDSIWIRMGSGIVEHIRLK